MKGFGYFFIVSSLVSTFYEYMNILSASSAGLGDINYSIAHFSSAILWGVFGSTLVVGSYIRELKDSENKK